MIFWTKTPYKETKLNASFQAFANSTVPRAGFTKEDYERNKIDLNIKLANAYEDARHLPLTHAVWRQLDNSRSWYCSTFVAFIREIAKIRSDITSKMIDDAFATLAYSITPVPVIVRFKTKKSLAMIGKTSTTYRVLDGNLRLMIYQLTGIKPRVVIVEI